MFSYVDIRSTERSRLFVIVAFLAVVSGCATYPKGRPVIVDENVRGWRVKQSHHCDYFEYLDRGGKVVALGYDNNGDGQPEQRIDLLATAGSDQYPHYVILLDGIPYQLVKELYDEGYFRLFYRPSELISCFPSMTDIAFCQMLGPTVPQGYEALWYDRARGRLTGGASDYLGEKNAPWQKLLDYRSPMILDAVGYVVPGFLFRNELAGLNRLFEPRPARRGTVVGYSVGTATVGTKKGKEGLIQCLKDIDALCEKIVYQHHGKCRITLAADHGHDLTPSAYFQVSKALKEAGFHVTNSLRKQGDVVCIEFGLVTCSAMHTDEPARVADALLTREQVSLAIYPLPDEKAWIIVRDRDGLARIRKGEHGYVYQVERGDPLRLKPIIEQLARQGKISPTGEIDDQSLFEATFNHVYPDPLARIHLAFNGLVSHPADIIITLNDGWFAGASDLAASVTVASTHGSLARTNSATFIMTTIRELPEAIRIADVKTVLPQIVPAGARR
jgi:hypothetical protein